MTETEEHLPNAAWRISPALRVAGIYLLCSAAYIFYSDTLVLWLVPPGLQSEVQSVKGFAFVSLSALLIFILMQRELGRVARLLERQQLFAARQQLLLRLSRSLAERGTEAEVAGLVCNFLVDNFKYPLAWVAQRFDGDSDLYPLATAGPAKNYVDEITSRFDDSSLGQGPNGTALREGRIVVSTNLGQDPSFVHWRKAAQKHGLAAKAAIPLNSASGARAVLSVYHATLQPFDEEELQLLETVANMLSGAMQRARLSAREQEERVALEERNRQLELQQLELSSEFTLRLEADEQRMQTLEAQKRLLSELAVPIAAEQRGRFIFVNSAYCELLGYSREELSGKSMSVAWPPELQAELQRRHDSRLAGHPEPTSYISEVVRKDGSRRSVMRHIVSTVFNDEPSVLWADLDISDLKRKEDALRESESTLRLLAEQATEMISLTDMDGRLIYVNPAVEPLLGYSPEELTGQQMHELIHPDDLAQILSLQGTELGSTLHLQYRVRHKDGAYFRLESSVKVTASGSVSISRLVS